MSRSEEFSGGARVFRTADKVRTETLDHLRPSHAFEVWEGQPGATDDRGHPDTTILRGRPLDRSDLPDTVYHVSTDAPSVARDGVIRARDGGEAAGLGGNHKGVVSATVDRKVAVGLKKDMRDYAMYATSGDVEGAMTHLYEEHRKRGMDKQWEGIQTQYDLWHAGGRRNPHSVIGEMFRAYHVSRAGATGERDPYIVGGVTMPGSKWHEVDPDKVGIIPIRKSRIPKNALVSNLDIGDSGGLEEARVHSDIPVGHREPF